MVLLSLFSICTMIGSIVFQYLIGQQNPPWLYITLGYIYYFILIIFVIF